MSEAFVNSCMFYKANKYHFALAFNVCDGTDAEYIPGMLYRSFCRDPNDPFRHVGATQSNLARPWCV